MLISITCGLLIFACTSLVGRLFTGKIPKSNSYLNLAFLNLAGMAFLVWLASIVEIAENSFAPVLIAVFIIALLFSISKIKKTHSSKISLKERLLENTEKIKYSLFTLGLGFLTAILQNPTLTSTRMSFRVGPDLAGWTAATKYFCENSSREKLTESINLQLGLQNVSEAFRNPIQFQDTYIGRIPSFTDQVTGEFLIGANRVGLPKLLAGYCTFMPDWLNNIMVGGMIWAVITLSLLIIGILKMKDISPNFVMAVVFVSIFNVNTISVLMEGGYGQFISLPFMISAIYFVQKQYISQITMPLIAIFLIFSLNAYQDSIIIFAILYFIYVLLIRLNSGIRSKINLSISRKVLIYCGLIVLINAHQIAAFSGLILERFRSTGVVGGWDQGKIAFPVNLLGVFNWLPYSSENHSWGLGFLLLTIFSSIVFVFLLAKSFSKNTTILSATILIAYLLISVIVYRKGLNGILTYAPDGTPVRGTNNYQVWKLMAYGTPLILLNISSEYSSHLKKKAQNLFQKGGVFLLILISLSSLTWMNDWIDFRSFSLETNKEFSEAVLDKHDVVIVGNWTGSAISMVLQGDVRYFLPSRGFELSGLRSRPDREISYLIPNGQCVADSCLSAFVLQRGLLPPPRGFEMIYRDKNVIAFIGKGV